MLSVVALAADAALPGTRLVTSVATGFLSSVASGLFTNSLEARLGDRSDFRTTLANRHLVLAQRDAIAMLLEREAEKRGDPDRTVLKGLREELGTRGVLTDAQAVALFATPASQPVGVVGTVDAWHGFIEDLLTQWRRIPRNTRTGLTLSDGTVREVAEVLCTEFAGAFRSVLKGDEGRAAFSALVMLMLGEIVATTRGTAQHADAVAATQQAHDDALERYGTLLRAEHAAVLDSVGALLDDAVRELKQHTSAEAERGRQHTTAESDRVIEKLTAEIRRGRVVTYAGRAQVWNLPYEPSKNFTGRTVQLDAIRDAFARGDVAALTALRGMGGVGKTQIALQYAYLHRDAYDVVWWISAEEGPVLRSDFAELAYTLRLADRQAGLEAAHQALRGWLLNTEQRWLLIFDNAPDAPSVKPFLVGQGGGHTLITSRAPDWRGVAEPVDVQTWPREDAIAFLLERTGRPEHEAAERLAETLGDLPLALEQAGAYIDENQISFDTYLDDYREQRAALHAYPSATDDYQKTIATTYELAFKRLSEESPAAIALLRFCAWLAPDDIPADLIRSTTVALPKPLESARTSTVAWRKTVRQARRYALLDADGDRLSVHRLVQAVTRDRMRVSERTRWADTALAIVSALFPSDIQTNVKTWPALAVLMPHSRSVTGDEVEHVTIQPKQFTHLLNKQATYERFVLADLLGARQTLERALAIDRVTYGSNHPLVAIGLNNLGGVFKDLGDLPAAREAFERALAIDQATYGPDHPEVAIRLNNLGDVLRALGDLPAAREAFERAITVTNAAYGPGHPNVAIFLSSYGLVLQDLGNLPAALTAFEHALAIDQSTYGPYHPNVTRRINNLGLVLQDLGDLPAAREAFERALAIDQATYGPDHPEVAIRLNNLGDVLRALGDFPAAREAFERALAISEATYGSDHPTVAIRVNNLGTVLWDLGDFPAARAAYERALAILERLLGPDHPRVATAANNLGNALQDLGDLSGARAAYKRALAILEQLLGPDHPNTQTVRGNLNSLNG
ncbi:MAG: FxSxx-COOH system tetratricopeptide repeat protein [Bacteroidota bacterium]